MAISSEITSNIKNDMPCLTQSICFCGTSNYNLQKCIKFVTACSSVQHLITSQLPEAKIRFAFEVHSVGNLLKVKLNWTS